MPTREFKIIDVMRGKANKTVLLRADLNDTALISCHTKYDRLLNGQVRILRQVEINEDGEWRPYPSVSWLDGVTHDGQLQTMAMVVPVGDTLIVMGSADGVPDGELMNEAIKAGVHTQSFK